jgi:hypothetical protein
MVDKLQWIFIDNAHLFVSHHHVSGQNLPHAQLQLLRVFFRKEQLFRCDQSLEAIYSLKCDALWLIDRPTLHENAQNLLTILVVEVSGYFIESLLAFPIDEHFAHGAL